MKLFVDSASLTEIEAAFPRGFASGVTTNPSILAKEEKRDYRVIVRDLINVITKSGPPLPLSVEVFTMDPDEMIRQAEELVTHFGDYTGLTIKVPVGWDELRLIARLTEMHIPVNATCCMSFNQAEMALDAGQRYVSLFYGRIRDTGYDAGPIPSQGLAAMERSGSGAEIIVGSIRPILGINEAIPAGRPLPPLPPPLLP